MPIPDYQSLMLPLLKVIANGLEHRVRDVAIHLAEDLQLTNQERQERLPSGQQTVIANRVAWARTYLKEAGLLESPSWGSVLITAEGRKVLSQSPSRIDTDYLSKYPSFVEFKSRSRTPEGSESTADSHYATVESISTPFAQFQENPVEQLRVYLRRKRAEQLRCLLANVDTVDLSTFNRDVWVFESSTQISGDEIKGKIFTDTPPTLEFCEQIRVALDSGNLELHGNYIWGTATRIFGPQLSHNDAEKLEHVRTALRVLNDTKLPPLEKAKQIRSVPGFGYNMATGLVMVYHPDQFAIWNKQSKGALRKLGYDASDLSTFQASVKALKDELKVADFLELDWFLYLVNQNQIQIGEQDSQAVSNIANPDQKARYWAIGLGEGGRLWQHCLSDGIIAIGWDYLGDMRHFQTKEEYAEEISKHRGDDTQPMNAAHACFQFTHEMKSGDYVFAKRGMSELYGVGIIESAYIYDPSRSEYRSIRKVKWLINGNWTIPDNARVPLKTLTDVSNYLAFLDFALPKLEEPATGGEDEGPIGYPYTIDHALEDLFISEERFKSILDSLSRKKNVILQGPPGVGKTYIARRLAYALIGLKDPAKVEMVQFHQSYAYEDFIQGWRPEEGGGFQIRNGVFYDFCKKAGSDETSPYVFIIDEINRSNLSKVFGELLMLIEADKRGPQWAIPLTYARDREDKFYIPQNIHIIGMMNTADRSLAMVDYALRRRFTFVDLRPAFDSEDFRSFLEENEVEPDVIEVITLRIPRLNEEIRSEKTNLGPGFEIGHSFFCPQGTEEELGMDWYHSVVQSEIAPLLREYWFDNLDKAESFISHLLE